MANNLVRYANRLTVANSPVGTSPIFNYQFDNAGGLSLTDRVAGNTYALTLLNGTEQYQNDTVNGITGLYFDYLTTYLANSGASVRTFGSFTLEVLAEVTTGIATIGNMVCCMYSSVAGATDSTINNNWLWSLRAYPSINKFSCFTEGPTGTQGDIEVFFPYHPANQSYNILRLYTLVRDSTGLLYSLYVDGELIATALATNAASDGSSSRVVVGGELNGPAGSLTTRFKGIMNSVRWFNVSFTDSQVRESFLSLRATPTKGTDVTKYINNDTYDSTNGNRMLNDDTVKDVYYYDATDEQWNKPTESAFYGYARDGYFYYNGVKGDNSTSLTNAAGTDINYFGWGTGNGIFAPRYLNVNFADESNDFYQSPVVTGINAIEVGGIKAAGDPMRKGLTSVGRWCFLGDFDIQVDYTFVRTAGDSYLEIMTFTDWFESYFYMARAYNSGNNYRIGWKDMDGGGSGTNSATADASGKLRVLKVGNNLSGYKWAVGAWVQVGATKTLRYFKYSPVYIEIVNSKATAGSTNTTTATISNFTINSGTPIFNCWANETASQKRSSRFDFPVKSMITTTNNDITITDLENNKMWMRFDNLQDSNNLLKNLNTEVGSVQNKTVMRNGIMLIARDNLTPATETGYALFVDFTTGIVKLFGELDGHYYRSFRCEGGIYSRNYGYELSQASGGGNLWNVNILLATCIIQDNRSYCCDLVDIGGYVYMAFGNAGGVIVYCWRRFYTYGAGTGENFENLSRAQKGGVANIVDCKFNQTSGNFYYMSATTIYIVTKAAIDAALSQVGYGGTFAIAQTIAPTGTLSLASQLKLEQYGNYLYYGADEGVYAIDLTTYTQSLVFTSFAGSVLSICKRTLNNGNVALLITYDNAGTKTIAKLDLTASTTTTYSHSVVGTIVDIA